MVLNCLEREGRAYLCEEPERFFQTFRSNKSGRADEAEFLARKVSLFPTSQKTHFLKVDN
jgi:hypothetical protein